MKLSAPLQKKIVDFLISLPTMHDSESQRAFIYKAGLDTKLQNQIHFGKPPVEFIPLLVTKLLKYGKNSDGHEALETLLEATKDFVGDDRRKYCDTLIQELHANLTDGYSEGVENKAFHHTKLLLILSLLIMLSVAVAFRIVVPLWEKNSILSAEKESIRHMQAKLIEYGYDAGAIDGQWGKKTELAIQQYQQRSSPPTNKELESEKLVSEGASFSYDGDFDAAITTYKKAIELDPLNSWAYHLLGYVLLRTHEADLALMYLAIAVNMNPKQPWFRYNFAVALGEVDRIDEGVVQLQKVVSDNPQFVNIIKDEVSEPNSQFEKFLNNEYFQKLIEN